MNNAQMYDVSNAGGVPYPETNKYHYSKWYTTTGLTDGSEYKPFDSMFVKIIYCCIG